MALTAAVQAMGSERRLGESAGEEQTQGLPQNVFIWGEWALMEGSGPEVSARQS